MTFGQSTALTSATRRPKIASCAAHVVFFIVLAATLVAGIVNATAQGSPTANYGASASQPQAGASAPQTGVILQVDLNHTINVAYWVETLGGCPDGDTGQWTINTPPGDGTTSTAIIGGTPVGSCAPNPPCDSAGPNPAGTLQCYGALQYTLTQPIPCGQTDTLNATWQSSRGVIEAGMWSPAYAPLAVTHNFFGPCNASLPFGSGIPFGGGVPAGGAASLPPANSTQNLALWQMSQLGLVNSALISSVPSNWSIIGQRDFDGDGYTDLLWRDSTTGTVVIWFMKSFQVASTTSLGAVPSNWNVYGTGNLDQSIDAKGSLPGSILWRDDTAGTVAIWFIRSGSVALTASLGVVPLSWKIVGSDNKGKIFWRDTSGNLSIWQMNGSKIVSAVGLGNVPPNWTISGLGDFYGDGNSGILWRDSNTNTVAIWRLKGTQIQSTTSLGVLPSLWSIVSTGDYNGDGKSDILLEDSGGNLAVWYMNGGQIASSAGLGNIAGWTVLSSNSE
jgi:hypothetical protein